MHDKQTVLSCGNETEWVLCTSNPVRRLRRGYSTSRLLPGFCLLAGQDVGVKELNLRNLLYYLDKCPRGLKKIKENLIIIDVLSESWNTYLQNIISRLRYETDTPKTQSHGWDMKQMSPKCNVPAEILNRYLQKQCPGWDMKHISPKYNVPVEIWNRYLQNEMFRLRYEIDISKIQCTGWDKQQISPKHNVSAQIWSRYGDVTAWAITQ